MFHPYWMVERRRSDPAPFSYIKYTIDPGIGWTVKAGISEEPRAHLIPAL